MAAGRRRTATRVARRGQLKRDQWLRLPLTANRPLPRPWRSRLTLAGGGSTASASTNVGHFRNLMPKAYTKRMSAPLRSCGAQLSRDLGRARMVERFPEIGARLKAMLEPPMATLDLVDIALISEFRL